MKEFSDIFGDEEAEICPTPKDALLYRIEALVREDRPHERAKADAGDGVRLAAELEDDASIRVAFRKLPGTNRIEGGVWVFGSATRDVSYRDLQFALGGTLFLSKDAIPLDHSDAAARWPRPMFGAAHELTRVTIASTEYEPESDPLDMRSDLKERFPPRMRPTYAAPTTDGWDSTAYLLKLMAQAEGEIWTWTDLGPATELEQQIVVDELNAIYTYAGIGRNTGSVVRARTVLAGVDRVPPMVRTALSRRSRELRLQSLDPAAAMRLWNDPVAELGGHATSQTHAEALAGLPGVWALQGVGMATKERSVLDRPLDPMPPAPANPIRLGWATDAFGQRVDVALDASDLVRHCFIEGQSGSGKTTSIGQLVWSLTRAGYQVIYLDPHGDGAARAAAYCSTLAGVVTHYIRHGDRQHPIRLNPLSEEDAESRERVLAELLELIQVMLDPNKEGMVGERFKRTFTLIAQATYEIFGPRTSLTDVLALSLTKEALQILARAVRPRSADAAIRLDSELVNLGDKEFAELISWFTSRLQPFLRTPALRDILGTGEDAVDVLSVIDKGENLIVDLASLELGEDVARVLGALWLLKVRQAMGRRKARRRPVVMLVDEAHLYTFGALPGLLAEARKFGIGVVVATQAADNLSPRLTRAIEANVGSAISLRTGINAASAASERLGGWPAAQLTRLEDLTAAASLSRGGMPTPAFTLHIDHFDVVAAEGWDAERLADGAEEAARKSLDALWAPFADRRVLDDASVIGNVRASMERVPPPRPRTAGDRTQGVLDEFVNRVRQGSSTPASTEAADPAATYDVVLQQRGDKLIQVVKEIREVTGLGLAEAKKLADNVGSTIVRGVPYPVAAKLQHRLGLAGANTRVQPSADAEVAF